MAYLLDTSVVIEKKGSEFINKGKIKGEIIIPKAVLAEIEHQANQGRETGLTGLEELQALQTLSKKGTINLKFIGDRPNVYQIRYAKSGGEIDSLIRDLAFNEDATLITADKIQAESAKAYGVKVLFIELETELKPLQLEKLFDNKTMSVHLKAENFALAKKGKPGQWNLLPISKDIFDSEKVKSIAKEIVERCHQDAKSFVEISRKGSTVAQYRNYRVVITKPPVSDGWEITAVKPLVKLALEDYNLPEEIAERVKTKARGVIIAGETGSGKSTIASALAEHYNANHFIVKTVESPRDLDLSEGITQYSKNFTTSEEIHDILFLSRPDYIIFDELRDTPDFKLYTDLRLAGSNCLGVLHAASAIDAVQRFIGRLETGMIPSVLDTILFIDKGNIGKVYVLQMTVKVPHGMTEADLARPIVVVTDFISGQVEFEIYSYGEETVVIPVKDIKVGGSPSNILASKYLEKELRNIYPNSKVEVISDGKAILYVPKQDVAKVIGKQGQNIDALEKKLGISLDVRELAPGQYNSKSDNQSSDAGFDYSESSNFIVFYTELKRKNIDVYINNEFLFTVTASKKGIIKIRKKSEIGKRLLNAVHNNQKIEFK